MALLSGVAVVAASAGPVAHVAAEAGSPSTAARIADSRAAAYAAYQDQLKPALAVPIGWTGSIAGCNPGAPSPAAQNATQSAVNYYRSVAGLPPVTFDTFLSAKAQAAALMMLAEGELSHDPGPTWACYSAAGRAGAGASNLYLGLTGAKAVAGYMTDPGAGNEIVGHRRWILYPPQSSMGSGSTSGSNALYVFGAQTAPATSPAWVPWPSQGYIPRQVEPGGRWSLGASDPSADFSRARVSVTSGGVALPVTIEPIANGYGSPTLVWQMDPGYGPGRADRSYDVSVTDIVVGGASASHRYTVTLFDGDFDAVAPAAAAGTAATAGDTQGTVSWQAPTPNGGFPITGYTVRASPGGQTCAWSSGPLSCTVTGLTNGTAYTFSVVATNLIGTGPASASSNAVTPVTAGGYRLVATDGGIFSFGDLRFHGSTGGIALTRPMVGMANSASGNGYWLVASDGGIFAFGDAAFRGSTGGITLTKPIVGMERTTSGNGYWLVASDGGIFAFGDAAFRGSTGGITLTRPIVGMERTTSGNGYWLVASDGRTFAFGDAVLRGSPAPTTKPIVGMSRSASGDGYRLVASDGAIFSFGAPSLGSLAGTPLARPIVGMAS